MKLHIIGEEIFADSLRVARLTGEHQDIVRQLDTEIDGDTDELECEIGDLEEQLMRAGDDAEGWGKELGEAIDCLGVNEKFTKAEILDSIHEAKQILERAQREMEKQASRRRND